MGHIIVRQQVVLGKNNHESMRAHLDRLPDPSDQFGLDPREVLPTSRAEWEQREVAPAQPMVGAK